MPLVAPSSSMAAEMLLAKPESELVSSELALVRPPNIPWTSQALSSCFCLS